LVEARGFDFPPSVRRCSLSRTTQRASCLTLGVLSPVLRGRRVFKWRRGEDFLYAPLSGKEAHTERPRLVYHLPTSACRAGKAGADCFLQTRSSPRVTA